MSAFQADQLATVVRNMVDINESSENNLKTFELDQTCETASIVSCQPLDTE